jgi:hypothetical protein
MVGMALKQFLRNATNLLPKGVQHVDPDEESRSRTVDVIYVRLTQ